MKLQRRYVLDVIRTVDAQPSRSGVRFALVEISWLKALEIAAMSNLKRNGPAEGRHSAPKPGPIFTEAEIIWTDGKFNRITPGFRCRERIGSHSAGIFSYKSLIAVDKKGGFHFWNIFLHGERVKTPCISVDILLADFKKTEFCDEGFVAPGMRRMLKQQELALQV
jgi:hypothetical protein